MEPLLDVKGVTLQYRQYSESWTTRRLVTAAYRVSFQVMRSERFVILGPSGCGKSTLLKAIGGFVKPTEGRVTLGGVPVEKPGSDRVFVFQEFDQLLPWKTVKQNITFALTATRRYPGREADERALHYIRKVNLSEFANTYPHMLSGGMKQRAAIARAMALEPQILLMDEPFAALDALTRNTMQDDLLQLWDEMKFTMLFVTHSIPEALRLGDRILLMSAHPGQVKAEINSQGADATRVEQMLFDRVIPEGAATDRGRQ